MEKPAPPPEAVLIRAARQALHLRVADCAAAAEISETRWTQIEGGTEKRHGIVKAVRAKADTIAHMARQVRITPERLRTEGQRPDAATVLEEILFREVEAASVPHWERELTGEPGVPAGAVQDDTSDPYLLKVRAALYLAGRNHPKGFTGAQAFPDLQAAANIWDSGHWRPEQAEVIIAGILRAIDTVTGQGEGGGSAQTGLGRS